MFHSLKLFLIFFLKRFCSVHSNKQVSLIVYLKNYISNFNVVLNFNSPARKAPFMNLRFVRLDSFQNKNKQVQNLK